MSNNDLNRVTIDGKDYIVNPEIGELLLMISLERDEYKAKLKEIFIIADDNSYRR